MFFFLEKQINILIENSVFCEIQFFQVFGPLKKQPCTLPQQDLVQQNQNAVATISPVEKFNQIFLKFAKKLPGQ